MVLVLLFIVLIIGIILAKVGISTKKIILSLVIAIILFTVGFGIYYWNYKHINDNWIMKATISGFDGGYDNTVYIYSNHNMIIEPAVSLNKIKKSKMNENIDLEQVHNYVEAYVETTADSYKYCIELKNGTKKNIDKNNMDLAMFFEELPLYIFATL